MASSTERFIIRVTYQRQSDCDTQETTSSAARWPRALINKHLIYRYYYYYWWGVGCTHEEDKVEYAEEKPRQSWYASHLGGVVVRRRCCFLFSAPTYCTWSSAKVMSLLSMVRLGLGSSSSVRCGVGPQLNYIYSLICNNDDEEERMDRVFHQFGAIT